MKASLPGRARLLHRAGRGLGSFIKVAGERAVLVIFRGSGKLSTEAGESTRSRFERACQNGGRYQ